MKSTKFWIIMIAVLLLVSAVASVFIFRYQINGGVVAVYHHGEQIKRIHLDTVTTPYNFMVGDDEHYNVISVERGRICVSEASCPDHICMETGWISDGAIPIVCLPNELVIKVEGGASLDGSVQ